MRVESIQTGQPRTGGNPASDDPLDAPWTSAIWKEPVEGRVAAASEGLSGDTQVAKTSHGGPERALLFYPFEHYQQWRAEWGQRDIGPGGFGENVTVSGLREQTVCVGDLFLVGELRVEVSGPRVPCMNLVRRFRRPELIERVVATDRSGWYGRVLNEGWLEKGLPITLLDRPYPQWTIDRAARVKRSRHPDDAALLASCPALLADWRAKLKTRR